VGIIQYDVTPASQFLFDEISRSGPIPFRRFMEVALYHPEFGYYRRQRDPFGKEGDFYTAEQVQPVFGRLISAIVRELCAEARGNQVVELGAGRGEMAPFFDGMEYTGIDVGRGELPVGMRGVIFSNEFFDALPVDVFVDGREQRVGFHDGRFVFSERGESIIERNPIALEWLERAANAMEDGYILSIDYGYTERERTIRFPQGTLMSYRRHTASEDVLCDAGERDITAHVNFTELQQHGERIGLETVRFETLGQLLMRAGERDQFASVTGTMEERMQLKTLLFGMGETFRVLLQRRRK